jgi:hypothetical protein
VQEVLIVFELLTNKSCSELANPKHELIATSAFPSHKILFIDFIHYDITIYVTNHFTIMLTAKEKKEVIASCVRNLLLLNASLSRRKYHRPRSSQKPNEPKKNTLRNSERLRLTHQRGSRFCLRVNPTSPPVVQLRRTRQ